MSTHVLHVRTQPRTACATHTNPLFIWFKMQTYWVFSADPAHLRPIPRLALHTSLQGCISLSHTSPAHHAHSSIARGFPCTGCRVDTLTHFPLPMINHWQSSKLQASKRLRLDARSSIARGFPCTACCVFTITPRPTYSFCVSFASSTSLCANQAHIQHRHSSFETRWAR